MTPETRSAALSRALAIVGLVLGLAGIISQYIAFQPLYRQMGMGYVTSAIGMLAYFTILTNLMMATAYWAYCFSRPVPLVTFFSRPGVRTAIAAYIAFVAIVYFTVIRGEIPLTPAMKVSDAMLHYIAPPIYLFWWALIARRGTVRYAQVSRWLIWPVTYLAIIMAMGLTTGRYVYPILDIDRFGGSAVTFNIVALIIVLAVLGSVLVAVSQWLCCRQAE